MIKRIIVPLFRYGLFMIIGALINVLLPLNIYTLPIIILPFYNFLALSYGLRFIKKENEKEILKLFPYLLIGTIIIAIVVMIVYNPNLKAILLLIIFNVIELYLLAKKIDKNNIDNIMQRNIDDYFKTNKK